MIKLVLVRHGQSIWNLENKFTGWTDVELTEQGIMEAHNAGKLLKENNYKFDVAYTSVLKRANDTLDIILDELNLDIPIHYDWHLNERFYGALQGLSKDKFKEEYGEDKLLLIRRSSTMTPPAITKDDPRYPGNDLKYRDLKEEDIPLTENLDVTTKRVIKYWYSDIKKDLLERKTVIIVAHGNSIRAIIKYLANLNEEQTMALEFETGAPICCEFDDDLKFIKYYYIR